MPAKVFACISHKGGTGRTTTVANVAYQLALENRSVCCVDLDLESPTFGAVAGLRGIERGAEFGIHDFLQDESSPRPPDLAPSALVDIWQNDDLPRPGAGRTGKLQLLPGSRKKLGLPLMPADVQGRILGEIVDRLRDEFDQVLLDVRSGASETVEAVLAANEELTAIRWLVFFRWTPQHLTGTGDLCERLSGAGADLELVRTAFSDPADMDSWFREQHRTLTGRVRDTLSGWDILTDIPAEPMLQWREGIVTEEHVRDGIASKDVVDSYQQLAARLEAT